MNPLGELFVKIGADVKGLKTGLASAETRVGKFAGAIKKHHRAIGMAMTAMGGAILAVGVLSVKTYAKMGDEVQKMALRTGFSTEALSELRHAAEISGAELSTLEKGTKRMAKTIVDASEGMATYIRAFDRIGLKVEELMGLKPEEQFNKIAMAIAGLEDPTLRAATAQDIFGRAGTQLLPLFAQGAEGIAELRQEAHKLGIVFDQEAANKAAILTDNMKRVDEAMSGVKIAIADVLAPIITELAGKLSNIITKMRAWMAEHPQLTKAIVLVTGAVGGLLLVLGPLLIMLPMLATGIGMVTAVSLPWLLIIGALVAGVALLAFGAYQLWTRWDEVTRGLTNLWNTIKTVAQSAFGAVGKAIEVMIKPIVRAIKWLNRLWSALMRIMGLGGRRAVGGGFVERGLVLPIGKGIEAGYMQRGGIVTRPTLAMVGEREPEAVIPLSKMGMGGLTIIFREPVFMENESSMNKLARKLRKVLREEERHLYGGTVA